MSNTPITMNERRARTYLACVQALQRLHEEFPSLFDDDPRELDGAEQMMLAALDRIRDNERRISAGRGHSMKVR